MNTTHAGRKLATFGALLLLGLLPTACVAQTAGEAPPDPSRIVLSESSGDRGAPQIDSPYAAYLAGLAAARNNDLSVAAEYLLTALKGDPDNPNLIRPVFLIVAGDGRQAEAVALAQRLAELAPGTLMADLVLIADAVDRGDWAAADAAVGRFPDRGLGALMSPLLGGWVALGDGRVDEAFERIDALGESGGLDLLYYLHSAMMAEAAGRLDEAAAAYEAALQLDEQPTLRLAWLSGNFYERQGQPQRAIEIYEAFQGDRQDDSLIQPMLERARLGGKVEEDFTGVRNGVAEVYFDIASLLLQEQARDMALLSVRQALLLRPNFVVAQVLLGEIYQEQGRGAEAIDVYREIPEDSPYAWLVGLRIADLYEELGDTDRAVAQLDSLAAVRPDQFEPLFRKGNLLRAQERFAEAVVAYDGAIERLGRLQPRHWALLYYRGIALERSKQWERAEADFLGALELEPEQPFVMNYLAYSWVEQHRNLDNAKSMLVRAVELRPNDGYIVDSLGWVYYRLGEYEAAVPQLERAVELRPQDPVINDHLGDALWRIGRRNEARFQWRRALSLEPEADQVPSIEGKLSSGLPDKPEDT
ncbi:MAG TPA: tetratricopeptide repeat protein [Kiloniellaceae bacterium]|nr:tetratricopeptide repeat protein [Kiloniellaceae bacterium]